MLRSTRTADLFPAVQKLVLTGLGYLLILYILSFLIFAVIRVLTGISIKRLGYFSLRHVSFAPRPGIQVNIGKVGLSLHRRTVARPGYLSLYISNFDLTVDPKVVLHPDYQLFHRNGKKGNRSEKQNDQNSSSSRNPESNDAENSNTNSNSNTNYPETWSVIPPKTYAFYVARFILKHAKYFDFSAASTSVTYTGIGSVIIGNFVLKIDLRNIMNTMKNTFEGTLETHRQLGTDEVPALCRLMVQDFYIADSIDDDQPKEFLDMFSLDVGGILGTRDLSIKDLSLAFKLGKGIMYLDKMTQITRSVKRVRQEIAMDYSPPSGDGSPVPPESMANGSAAQSESSTSAAKVLSERDVHNLTKIGTLLVRVVKEVEIKFTYLGVFGIPAGSGMSFAASAKDLSLDTRRLNPQSPGFKLFFNESDSAHQAIFSMSSVGFGVDVGADGNQKELVYIPMVTMISKTNIFSKTLQFVRETKSKTNESIFRANVNITSPTVDLEAHHVPILVESVGSSSNDDDRISHTAKSFQRLWPRTAIKFTVDEPAARLLLSPAEGPGNKNSQFDYDDSHPRSMVISSSSKINCDFESSHSNDPENPSYSSHASLQVSSYDAWYRSPSGSRYDVFLSENLLLKITAVMNPTVSVTISGMISNAHVLLTKSEVFRGIREFCLHLKKGSLSKKAKTASSANNSVANKKSGNVLRQLPPWLSRLKIEIADTAVSLASEQHQKEDDIVRGLTVQMSNSVLDYRSDRGRKKLAMIMEGIEGYKIIEPFELDKSEGNRFLQIPSLSVALGTESAAQVQCNVIMKNAVIKYDINLHFLGLLSVGLLANTLALDKASKQSSSPTTKKEKKQSDFIGVHVKTGNIRIKVELPNDAHIMLETNSLEMQRKKDYRPRLRAKAIRMYSLHPNVPNAWGRIISLKGAHAEYKSKTESDDSINLSFDGMRLNMPSQYIFHKVLDNMVTLFKATINLQHRYTNGDEFYEAVTKPKERSKMPNIPKIRIKTPALLMSLEDDHFESQLGLIFQVGAREQKKRIQKEQAFERKVKEMNSNGNLPNGGNLNRKRSGPHLRTTNSSDALGPSTGGQFSKRRNSSTSQVSSVTSEKDLHPVDEEPRQTPPKSATFSGTSDTASTAKRSSAATTGHQNKRHIVPPLRAFHRSTNRKDTSSRNQKTQESNATAEPQISVEVARARLDEHFSASWIQAYNAAYSAQKSAVQTNIEDIWGCDDIDAETAANERIVEYSKDPLMFYALFRGLDLTLRKPAFDDQTLRKFLHQVGKGLPMDTRFSLLVPLHIDLKLSELRGQLRDFPLPFLHFPELNPSQDQSIPSVTISGNFVVAEELWLDEASLRRIKVPLVPLESTSTDDSNVKKYIIDVVRTISSVKMYTDLSATVNTMNPTRITWANSIQPAIQSVMLGFDSFTKPPIDPSAKLGFWDKIRAIFHARLRIHWTEGDVFLLLKGSRSPYELLGTGAGFVMGWRNNVVLTVNGSDDPKRLLVADSEEYILAVPDYVAHERDYLEKCKVFQHASMPRSNFNETTTFKKVVMKLSGKVQWIAGLLFEMDKIGSRERTSDFKPHYEIQLKRPDAIENKETYDAYDRFRSEYMHMAITVTSPELEDASSYNTIHLTPRVLYQFQKWWGLFDGSLSLPTRSGALFQPQVVKKPKFGRHLFTVKYKLLLSPLFIAHNYRHPHSENLTKHNRQASTGLKGKVGIFSMDLHQRREHENGNKRGRMKVHMGELDFKSTDLRVILAQFKEKSPQEFLAKKLGIGASPGSSISNENASSSANQSSHLSGKFKISDNDFSWIDMDDYVELEDTMPMKSMPKIVVLPMVYSPRWTYFRQTDHSQRDTEMVGDEEVVKFGKEAAHDCLIGKSHPETTQHNLLKKRVEELDEQLKTDDATLDSLSKDLQNYPNEESIKQRIDDVQAEIDNLSRRKEALLGVLDTRRASLHGDDHSFQGLEDMANPSQTNENSFNNRFIIHNVQLKWNNSVRNAVYRYMHQAGNRRAYSYFVTRKAVKYIEDLIKINNESGEGDEESKDDSESTPSSAASYKEQVEKVLGNIFKADKQERDKSNTSDNGDHTDETKEKEHIREFQGELDKTEPGLCPQDTYLVRLTSPQIQLVSDQNPDQCVVVTSQNIELKVISVMDKEDYEDEVSGLVETRYGLLLQDAQFFVISRQDVSLGSVALFSTNTYGCSQMSSSWPPWLALEICYESSPLKDQLVVEKTSVTLRYDKPNPLRLQKICDSSKDEGFSSKLVRCERYRANRVAVDFPKVVATCDSSQYFTIYTIVIDLLIYSEPNSQRSNEKLEELLLATDFSDLNGAMDRLNELQQEIRQLQTLRDDFAIKMGHQMDEKATEDLMEIQVELQQVILELLVMMRAIRTGLQKGNHRDTSQLLKWAIASNQVIWHVLDTDRNPFLDIGLADASFNRIESGDGFNSNTIEVGMMQGFHLSPTSVYPEMFSPYLEENSHLEKGTSEKLIHVKWTMLDPIGGIPIVDNFHVKLLPLKLQMDHDTGQKVFEYIFPSSKDESPFMVSKYDKKNADDSEDDEAASSATGAGVDDKDSDSSSSEEDDTDFKSVYSNDGESVASSRTNNHSKHWLPGQSGNQLANRVLKKSSSFANSRGGSLFGGSHGQHRDISPSTDTSSITRSKPGSHFGHTNNHAHSKPSSIHSGVGGNRHKRQEEDHGKDKSDFAVMVKRASNYMSIVDVKIESCTLCISYKVCFSTRPIFIWLWTITNFNQQGHGTRNLTDIHEFVIRLPDLEYQNKTWSNLDLVVRLKKGMLPPLLAL